MLLYKRESFNLETYRPSPLPRRYIKPSLNLSTSRTSRIDRKSSSKSLTRTPKIYGTKLPNIYPTLKTSNSIQEKVYDGIKVEEVVMNELDDDQTVRVGFVAKKGFCVAYRMVEGSNEMKKHIQLYRRVGKYDSVVSLLGSQPIEPLDNLKKIMVIVENTEAGNLQQVRDKFGLMPMETIKTIMRKVLIGLAHIHSKQIVHMDLRAKNVMIDSSGNYKIGGWFKKAELVGTELKGVNTIQEVSSITPPESILCQQFQVNHSYDIWQVGCLLLNLCNPKILRINLKTSLLDRKQYLSSPFFFSRHLQKYPSDFLLFVQNCLQRNPRNRPKAADLLNQTFFTATEQ